MKQAVEKAQLTIRENIGGPFGAAIVDEHDNLVVHASNTVLGDCDPTAHAEINAIRMACKKLGTHDLSGHKIYATGYPCPMCLSAIIWANIKQVYYGCEPEDADAIGFRDDFIYDYIQELEMPAAEKSVLKMESHDRELCLNLYKEYKNMKKKIY